MIATAKVGPNYQLVIPKKLRESAKFKIGDLLKAELRGDGILLTPTVTAGRGLDQRISELPIYSPTKAELRAIEKGRAAVKRGEFFTLEELFGTVAGDRRKARVKSRRTRASA